MRPRDCLSDNAYREEGKPGPKLFQFVGERGAVAKGDNQPCSEVSIRAEPVKLRVNH
jgi:hypothetical protein